MVLICQKGDTDMDCNSDELCCTVKRVLLFYFPVEPQFVTSAVYFP
jgi:hypothetical protein